MKIDQTKRVQAFPPSRPLTDLKDSIKPATASAPRQAAPQTKPDSMTIKIKRQMAGREKCMKHKAYKVAFDDDSNTLMCNQCLFEQQMGKSSQAKPEALEFNQHHHFTALMTRDIKTKFDGLYKGYKDGLCEVAEIDHANVKELLLEQGKTFFATMRTKVANVRHEVNERVRNSQALKSLEELIGKNKEYFGENAGDMLAKEKQAFDFKLLKGRYASVVKDQNFYREVIATLDQAD